MFRRLLIASAAIATSMAWAGFVAGRAMWRRWGVDAVEAARSLPGDELVAQAEGVDTRGIDIAAPPAAVWPWLVQMGYGRGGWYSYDQLDMDHPSANQILPEFQSIEVGDILPTDSGGGFEVKLIEPEHSLVLYLDRALVEAQRGVKGGQPDGAGELEATSPNVRATGAYLNRAMSGEFAASWAFILEPRDGGTRLLERFRIRMEPPTGSSARVKPIPPFARSLLGFGVFVMVRRQMLGIRDRVEGQPSRIRSVQPPLTHSEPSVARSA
jgi:hypothetical protein